MSLSALSYQHCGTKTFADLHCFAKNASMQSSFGGNRDNGDKKEMIWELGSIPSLTGGHGDNEASDVDPMTDGYIVIEWYNTSD